MNEFKCKQASIQYADYSLYDTSNKRIGSAKPSPNKIGVMAWDISDKNSEQTICYGEFATLNEAVKKFDNIFGEFNTIFYCFNNKGKLIWEGRFEEAIALTGGREIDISVIDPDIFRKASPGMIKVFSYAVSTDLPGGSKEVCRGEFYSFKKAIDQLNDPFGGDGFVTIFSCFDENGTCLLSQLYGPDIKKLLDTDILVEGGTASELLELMNGKKNESN